MEWLMKKGKEMTKRGINGKSLIPLDGHLTSTWSAAHKKHGSHKKIKCERLHCCGSLCFHGIKSGFKHS